MNVVACNTTTIRRDPHYFLNRALEPIREFLDDPRVVEIAVNKPGHVYVERFGADYMEHHLIGALTGDEIQNIGERVAAATNQFISRSRPILSAALPTGERIQIVLPPAAPGWLDIDPEAGGQ
ncbi:ATPase, T2SS/T4P/T4SS family (plasmid) [Sinorhizobium meliloti]